MGMIATAEPAGFNDGKAHQPRSCSKALQLRARKQTSRVFCAAACLRRQCPPGSPNFARLSPPQLGTFVFES